MRQVKRLGTKIAWLYCVITTSSQSTPPMFDYGELRTLCLLTMSPCPTTFLFLDASRTQVDCAALRIVLDWPKLSGVSMASAMVLVLFWDGTGSGPQ